MKINEISELLKVIDKTNLEYVKLESSDLKLEVSKKSNMIISQADTNSNDLLALSNEDDIDFNNKELSIEENNQLSIINAPLMGTFYSAPNPNEDNFVKVGSIVNIGDTLCILEAMKLMNEINSDVYGEVVEILVNNEELVEYNQPLFKIKPL